ncbi:MAG: pilus assembly protein PilM, partial [Patescibacteria group bacterium]
KKIVDSYLDVLSKAKLIPTVLEIEAAAISRLVVESNKETKPLIVIDIGASRTGLFLCENKTVKFTVSLPISGNQITQLIADTLDLDWEKAEQAKIICGLDPTKGQGALLEIFADTIDGLTGHIRRAIAFHQDNYPSSQPVEKIVICGGGANFANINQILGQKLNLIVETSQPWKDITNPDHFFFDSSKSQSYVTALGLALRGLASETFL